MAIHFFEEGVKAKLGNKRPLKAFIQQTIKTHLPEIKQVNMNYIFCDDAYLLEINQQFLQHDTFTDIITFDLSPDPTEMESEIYISVDRVKENAAKFDSTYERELHRVIFHGALHLSGFKDKKKEDAALMRTMEDKCLNEYFDINKG